MPQTTRLAFSLFLTALILGVVGDVLLRPTPWGINLLLWVLALVFGLVAAAQWNNLHLTGGGRWLIGPAVGVAAMFALRDSITLNSANLLAILICLAAIPLIVVTRYIPDRAVMFIMSLLALAAAL